MNKQELAQNVIKLLMNERELSMMYVIDFMNDRLTKEELIKRLNQTYDNTNFMLLNKIERLEV